MVMVTILAASPLLAVGAPRSFLQLIQLLLRPFSNSRFFSRQPVFFAIAPDMLPCEISIRHRRLHPGVAPILITISTVRRIRRCPDEPWSWCVSIADFMRVQRFRFLDPILCQNGTLVSHWSLTNPDSVAPSLIQTVCWHSSARTSLFLRKATDSCKPFQNHTKSAFLLSFFT